MHGRAGNRERSHPQAADRAQLALLLTNEQLLGDMMLLHALELSTVMCC